MSQMPSPVRDTFGRPLRSLRLSVTDRCNLRCGYCMPETSYRWLPTRDILTFEELCTLVGAFRKLGVSRLRLTGGEPLLRKELPSFVHMLTAQASWEDLAMTTNGVLLESCARELKSSGLQRVTISLDTLHRETFQSLTKKDELSNVLRGIETAKREGFANLKLDTVLIRGVNDREIPALVAFARELQCEIRFIEYMDVGGATHWTRQQVVSKSEILDILTDKFGPPTLLPRHPGETAQRYRLRDGTTLGIIASTTVPFCQACDRSRLTADGRWFRCLYAKEGTDLKTPLRRGVELNELHAMLVHDWAQRDDRGAEERLALADQRIKLFQIQELQANPHLEMHTRGG